MNDVEFPSACQKTSQDFNELFCPLELASLGLVLMLSCNARVVTAFLSNAWVPGFVRGDLLQLL